ncbi:hypothetical protein GCM10028809_03300 [Spirosoma gilvum]
MTKNAQQAEDFTHDIFLKAHANLSSFQHRSTYSTWLWSITHNYCADQFRATRRKAHISLTDGVEQHLADLSDNNRETDQATFIQQSIQAMSDQDQLLIHMRYEEGVDLITIAQHLNLSLSAVKMRLLRIRRKIYLAYQSAEL